MNASIDFDALLTLAQNVDPWIKNPGMLGAILGSSVGLFGGVYGTLVGVLAPRGKGRSFVFAMHWIGISVGVSLIALAIAALSAGQPYHVWYGFGLPGVLLAFLLLMLTPAVRQRYREAEHRRVEAENFRRG